ncbi:hypothetical protein Tco_0848546 [Tanacetum coccineum]
MMDVPIHQEDPVIQRTPLVDSVISMVTEKSTQTPPPQTTQAQVTDLSESDSSSKFEQKNSELEKTIEVMPMRAWTKKDQKRTDEMVQVIDNLLLKRQFKRSLECYVGGRTIETDYRLYSHHGPSDAMHNPPKLPRLLSKESPTHHPCDLARTFRVILFKYSQLRMEILSVSTSNSTARRSDNENKLAQLQNPVKEIL